MAHFTVLSGTYVQELMNTAHLSLNPISGMRNESRYVVTVYAFIRFKCVRKEYELIQPPRTSELTHGRQSILPILQGKSATHSYVLSHVELPDYGTTVN